MNAPDPAEIFAQATARLLAERNAAGHWEGELSSSALSTATALFALRLFARHTRTDRKNAKRPGEESSATLSPPHVVTSSPSSADQSLPALIDAGVAWLVRTQNPDGGFGDTIRSGSNISTSALCWAALAEAGDEVRGVVARLEAWLVRAAGSLEPRTLARAIGDRYGKDRTFSVPILTMCALAGRLGEGRAAWRHIPQLPFELAACPYRWFQIIRLPVVSYALPALIAMGHARHARRPTRNPVARLIRRLTKARTLRVLESIQPTSGGFLEATPLTSFVVMSLIGAGHADHLVVRAGVDFLIRSVRPDGSWPIDTNLSTWVTTLSINALGPHPEFQRILDDEGRRRLRDWLLGQQYRVEHPYTHAAPGAWAWTDLPGGVPDADDTAGALIALAHLAERDADATQRFPRAPYDPIRHGIRWLLDLQNRDGGIPTFCRGWGSLPFDRSGSDLTAHALHAWAIWKPMLSSDLATRVEKGMRAALDYLRAHQSPAGAWSPLWFGNEACVDEQNLTYGTARVLAALAVVSKQNADDRLTHMIRRGIAWLQDAQNADGSWGGGIRTAGSVEETALAIHALVSAGDHNNATLSNAIRRGADHLRNSNAPSDPAPIGFYFAKLWYFEKLYPLIFQAGAWCALEAHHQSGPAAAAAPP